MTRPKTHKTPRQTFLRSTVDQNPFVHVLHNNPFVLRSLTSLKAELNDVQSPLRMQLNFTEETAIYCDPLPMGYSLQRDLLMACNKKLSNCSKPANLKPADPAKASI